jgi:hypothetical protein
MIYSKEGKAEIQKRIDSDDWSVGGSYGEGWFFNLGTTIFSDPIEAKFVCIKDPNRARKAYIKYIKSIGYNEVDHDYIYLFEKDGEQYHLLQCGGTSRSKEYKVL